MKKFYFLLFFLLFHCLEVPKLPQWDFEINIPLLEKNFTIYSLIDSQNFKLDQDSTLNFFYEYQTECIHPIEKITIKSTPLESVFDFQSFTIFDTVGSNLSFGFDEILGIPLPETTIRIAPFYLERELNRQIVFTEIRNCFIVEGLLKATFINQSAVHFGRITITNLQIRELELFDLSPNSQVVKEERIGEFLLNSPVLSVIQLNLSASDTIEISCFDSLKILLRYERLRISSGEFKLKEGELEDRIFFQLSTDQIFKFSSGEAKAGTGEISLLNNFPCSLSIDLKIPDLNLSFAPTIAANEHKKISFSLQGKEFVNRGEEGYLVLMKITLRPFRDFVRIEEEHNFVFNLELKNLCFEKIRGEFLEPLCLTEKVDSFYTSFLGNPKALKVGSAILLVSVTQGVNFPGQLILSAKSINRHNQTCSLHSEIPLPPGNYLNPSSIIKEIPITDLINIGPRIVRFSYRIKIFGKGEINFLDFFLSGFNIEIPLKVVLVKDTVVADEREILISEKTQKVIRENLVSGEITLDLSNHFPLGTNGVLVLKKHDAKQESDSITIPFSLPAGEMSRGRYCVKTKDTTLVLSVGEDKIHLFENCSLLSYVKLNFQETDTVYLRRNDFIKVRSYATLKWRVNK